MGSKAGVLKVAAKRVGLTVEEYLARLAAGQKRCVACKAWKPLTAFGFDATRGDGRNADCLECNRVKVRVCTKGRPSPMLGRKHTLESRAKMSAARTGNTNSVGHIKTPLQRAIASARCKRVFSGPGNFNWRGGITPENARVRTSREYVDWRTAVYHRDGYACQVCGDDRGGNLNAHHIYPFAKHPELRLNVDNGITVCEPCHERLHHNPYSTRNRRKARGLIRTLRLIRR